MPAPPAAPAHSGARGAVLHIASLVGPCATRRARRERVDTSVTAVDRSRRRELIARDRASAGAGRRRVGAGASRGGVARVRRGSVRRVLARRARSGSSDSALRARSCRFVGPAAAAGLRRAGDGAGCPPVISTVTQPTTANQKNTPTSRRPGPHRRRRSCPAGRRRRTPSSAIASAPATAATSSLASAGRQRQRTPRALLPHRHAGRRADDQQRHPHRPRAAAWAPRPAPAVPGYRRRKR